MIVHYNGLRSPSPEGNASFTQLICIKKLIQQASKKYGANAPQLHHIFFAPAWGAIPDQRAREKQKNTAQTRHSCTLFHIYQEPTQEKQKNTAQMRHSCTLFDVLSIFVECSATSKPKSKKIRRKRATVAPYLSGGGKPTRQSPAVGIARSILLYSCIQQNQPVPFV